MIDATVKRNRQKERDERIRAGLCIGFGKDMSGTCDEPHKTKGLCTACYNRFVYETRGMSAEAREAFKAEAIREGRILAEQEVRGIMRPSRWSAFLKGGE